MSEKVLSADEEARLKELKVRKRNVSIATLVQLANRASFDALF